MDPLETYLAKLRDIHSTGAGTPETSYYPALEALFSEVGRMLKPRVTCVMGLKQQGAGLPDGGLFTADQLRNAGGDPPISTIPARGAIEVKPAAASLGVTVQSDQVRRYLRRYQQVLVTNLREFVLVAREEDGEPRELEGYRLGGGGAEEFWDNAVAHPRAAANLDDGGFAEFIRRVILHPAPLAAPKDVAWFLASYAREALRRIGKRDLPALTAMRTALEQALGIKFESEKGAHFFRSTLVQTLFYGVFAAWVLWRRERGASAKRERFNWRLSEYSLRVPIVAALFHQVSSVSQLEELRIVEPLDWAGNVLNRVEPGPFFEAFEQHHAVQYFYEPFLQAYDPELRKQLGVWYTPPEIVTYMVERVDSVLRSELGLADGLADDSVIVLDPCCGTGSYIVEVLRRIHDTMKEKGADALTANRVKAAATNRVFGFEIMPAPFVIAHLQIGLALRNLGAPLSDKTKERAGVYLTNALTGWEPPEGPKQHILAMPELEVERDAADKVKHAPKILVILGNPPYNAFDGISPDEEKGLLEPYKAGLVAKWGIKKFNLDDLYVRFFRMAERRIAEMTGRGVVAFISNFSYLSDPSFVVMRQRFLSEFDRIWIDCLNGDSRETGKLTPEGRPDPSVFSTEQNREGIRVGTAIGVLVRRGKSQSPAAMGFRQFWGTSKREDLLTGLTADKFDTQYASVEPSIKNRYSFRPSEVSAAYSSWPRVIDLCAIPPSNGLMEKRGGALIDIDPAALEKRMRAYLDRKLDWEEYKALGYGLTDDQAAFEPKKARERARSQEEFGRSRIVRYAVRAFDTRWCYYTDVNPVWNRARPALWAQFFEGNSFLTTRPAGVAQPEGVPFFFTRALGDNDFLRGHAYYFPLKIKGRIMRANFGKAALEYLEQLNVNSGDSTASASDLLWMHALAVGYSPAYLTENADGVRQDWPRIPLPNSRELLAASAELGRKIAALLDTENQVDTVTAGKLRADLASIGAIASSGGGNLDPAKGHLALTAGWGHAGKAGVVMPARGRILKRGYTQAERDAIAAGGATIGLSGHDAMDLLGADTCDVYLNDIAYWRNIPARVWEYTIGGYQVIKKWLSYRERELLHRDLTPEEVAEVTAMARRIAAIVLMTPALDANYQAIKANTYAWPAAETPRA
ncbi:MAG TPA: type ISP restriction/modification enzyme [Candidatus Binataceae bacterium]|nr:type ISP restriction/modification enzyme [Candidatus Binataceae bacterium]